MCKIGIIGHRKDVQVTTLQTELQKKGAKAYLIDFNGLATSNYLSLNPVLQYDDLLSVKDVPFKDLDMIYIRNFATPEIGFSNLQTYNKLSVLSTQLLNLQFSLINLVGKNIPIINRLEATAFHRLKTAQHHLLYQHKITVPDTLVTNNINKAKAFINKHKGKVIVKPQASGAEVVMADQSFFDENQEIMKSRPFIFQQFVSGRSIRAYLLGGEIVSAGELFFDRKYIDWRERVNEAKTFEVPEELAKELTRSAKILGLTYCAIDVEYDNTTEQYYLLDFNPSGLYIGWSNLLRVNMPSLIADYLIKVVKNNGQLWY